MLKYTLFIILLMVHTTFPGEKPMTNSIGMKFVKIPAGEFLMGEADGDYDAQPVHRVRLSQPFLMSATPVTNAQYEQFDPSHRHFRGYNGFSTRDDEAVIFVSWEDAVEFCAWLSKREGKTCRLPTEAEWEYACRAGTTTRFHTGDRLLPIYLKNQKNEGLIAPVSLRVGGTPPNAWGLHDLHGCVEEWCLDWYGPYPADEQTDPVGRATGLFKVTRGGSHNTPVEFLRSANRSGTLPEDKHALIGFRVVCAELPQTKSLPAPEPSHCFQNVSQKVFDWQTDTKQKSPVFSGPVAYIREVPNPREIPMYYHNHCPAITWCENGDLLAIWFSTVAESGREMVILGSRLRAGNDAWDTPSRFFKAPDRNMTGSSLLHDGKGKIYFLNGMETAGTWEKLAIVQRTSTDNGATWSKPRLVNPFHQQRNQVIAGLFQTRTGDLVQPCDAVSGGTGGTALHISRDQGETWKEVTNVGWGNFARKGQVGGWIAGIHAGVAELTDGRFLAFGRGDDINGRMPMSISADGGSTWRYAPSEFPPISSGQRLVLMRLQEGPLLFVSFTDASRQRKTPTGLLFENASGEKYRGFGLFAALSSDDGKTWPVKKLITPGGTTVTFNGGGHTSEFVLDATHAEPMGYLAATQSPDGVIHLISSRLYYRFNLAWLQTAAD